MIISAINVNTVFAFALSKRSRISVHNKFCWNNKTEDGAEVLHVCVCVSARSVVMCITNEGNQIYIRITLSSEMHFILRICMACLPNGRDVQWAFNLNSE